MRAFITAGTVILAVLVSPLTWGQGEAAAGGGGGYGMTGGYGAAGYGQAGMGQAGMQPIQVQNPLVLDFLKDYQLTEVDKSRMRQFYESDAYNLTIIGGPKKYELSKSNKVVRYKITQDNYAVKDGAMTEDDLYSETPADADATGDESIDVDAGPVVVGLKAFRYEKVTLSNGKTIVDRVAYDYNELQKVKEKDIDYYELLYTIQPPGAGGGMMTGAYGGGAYGGMAGYGAGAYGGGASTYGGLGAGMGAQNAYGAAGYNTGGAYGGGAYGGGGYGPPMGGGYPGGGYPGGGYPGGGGYGGEAAYGGGGGYGAPAYGAGGGYYGAPAGGGYGGEAAMGGGYGGEAAYGGGGGFGAPAPMGEGAMGLGMETGAAAGADPTLQGGGSPRQLAEWYYAYTQLQLWEEYISRLLKKDVSSKLPASPQELPETYPNLYSAYEAVRMETELGEHQMLVDIYNKIADRNEARERYKLFQQDQMVYTDEYVDEWIQKDEGKIIERDGIRFVRSEEPIELLPPGVVNVVSPRFSPYDLLNQDGSVKASTE